MSKFYLISYKKEKKKNSTKMLNFNSQFRSLTLAFLLTLLQKLFHPLQHTLTYRMSHPLNNSFDLMLPFLQFLIAYHTFIAGD